jgi:hypothetical protein
MAKSQEQKKKEAEEKALADAAIFGGAEPTRTADEMGVVQPNPAAPEAPVVPSNTPKSMAVPKEDTVNISRSQFEAIMGRLNDLESVALNSERATSGDDIFNPLAEVKSDHIVKVAFHGDEMVVGYKEKVRVDGRKTFTWLAKEPTTGEVRTFVTLLLRNMETKEVREETVDYVAFLEAAVTLDAAIKERKDIGKLVEQGLVNQMTWNGRTLVPTNTKIMTGAKEQKFLFTVELNGERIQLPENVVNIKS